MPIIRLIIFMFRGVGRMFQAMGRFLRALVGVGGAWVYTQVLRGTTPVEFLGGPSRCGCGLR